MCMVHSFNYVSSYDRKGIVHFKNSRVVSLTTFSHTPLLATR
jgi:hypothetical protein